MSTDVDPVFCFFPLPGLRYDGPVPAAIGDGLLYRFSLTQWMQWEQTTVFEEELQHAWARETLGEEVANPLPWGLLVDSQVEMEDLDEAIPIVEDIVDDVVVSLRLHGTGEFIDPAYVCRYARAMGSGLNIRATRLYREHGYGYEPAEPYHLVEADVDAVAQTADLLRKCHELHREASLGLAVRNFRYSFGSYMDSHARLALLFTSLEAMVDPFPTRVDGVSTVERLVQAVQSVRPDDSETVAFVRERLRPLRNRVFHAGPSTGPVIDPHDVDRVATVTRATLLSYARFLADAEPGPPGAGRARFNAALAAASTIPST